MIETAICDSFLREREDGVHQAGDEYRLALVRRGAVGSYGAGTRTFGEVASDEAFGNGYRQGGLPLTGRSVDVGGGVAQWSFDDVKLGPPEGAPVTIAIEGAVIFNATKGGRMLSTHRIPARGIANGRLVIRMGKALRLAPR